MVASEAGSGCMSGWRLSRNAGHHRRGGGRAVRGLAVDDVEGGTDGEMETGRVGAGDAAAGGMREGAVERVRRADGAAGLGRADHEWRKGSGWWDYMWMEDIREGEGEGEEEEVVG